MLDQQDGRDVWEAAFPERNWSGSFNCGVLFASVVVQAAVMRYRW